MTKQLYNVKSVKGQKKTFMKELESEIHELRVENEKLKSEVAYWKQKAANNDEVTEKGDLSVIVQKFASVEVKNQQILPENMVINSFGPNLDVLIHNYPFIAFLFNFLFTGTQRRKERANATAKEWKNWLQLYKCFIADMLLRTKKAKSVLITPMLISMVLLYTRASDSLWTLLSKLRIACLQPKLKDWIINQPEKKISEENVLLFSFDNCDFFRHVTNVRSSNKSTMINTCTQLVADLGVSYEIMACDVWNPMSKHDFVDFVCEDFDFANQIVNEAFSGVSEVAPVTWLKFAPVGGPRGKLNENISILPTKIPCNTSTYADVKIVLTDFYEKYVSSGERTFVFVNTDQACHTLVWNLKNNHKDLFSWVIPVPGEWHWTWHIMKGIFRMWGTHFFLPWSKQLKFATLDVHCKNFHYGEDFLQIVTIALCKVAHIWMARLNCSTLAQLLHKVHRQAQLYEVLYLLFYYLCPYWHTRSALRNGNYEKINNLWKYWLHLFIATNKWKYTQLTVRFLWVMSALDPNLVELYNKN